MVSIKLIFMVLAIADFVVSMEETDTVQECLRLVNIYLNELLKRFLEAHKNNLNNMFEDPNTWCINYLKKYIGNYDGAHFFNSCDELMAIDENYTFGDTQESALTLAFLYISYSTNKIVMKATCEAYYLYIKEKIEEFVKYTYARSPLCYCNNRESPPRFLVVVYQNGTFQTIPNQFASSSSGGPNENEEN